MGMSLDRMGTSSRSTRQSAAEVQRHRERVGNVATWSGGLHGCNRTAHLNVIFRFIRLCDIPT